MVVPSKYISANGSTASLISLYSSILGLCKVLNSCLSIVDKS